MARDAFGPLAQVVPLGNVNDQRVIRRPPFSGKDALHRRLVSAVSGKAVHGLGWHDDKLAAD